MSTNFALYLLIAVVELSTRNGNQFEISKCEINTYTIYGMETMNYILVVCNYI